MQSEALKSMKKGFKTTPVSRITLFCRDLEKSLALYRDILGFEEVESKTIQTKAFNELMNIHDKNCFVRISYLQSERSEHGVIVLSTKDHKKIYRELNKKDYTFLVEPSEYEKLEDSEYIKAGLYKEMSFYDPDGFLINLIEYN